MVLPDILVSAVRGRAFLLDLQAFGKVCGLHLLLHLSLLMTLGLGQILLGSWLSGLGGVSFVER